MQEGKTLWLVWLAAISLAILAIRLLIGMSPQFALAVQPKEPIEIDVILGSSLSANLLPPRDEVPSLMNNSRDTEVLSVPGATALETLNMLEWAINHTRGDIVIEVNAFTLQHSHRSIPAFPWFTAALEGQPALAANMTFTVKQLIGLTPGKARQIGLTPRKVRQKGKLGRSKERLPNDIRKPKGRLSYFPQSFLYPENLKAQIRRLAQKNRKVVFLWPPVPEGGAGSDWASWRRAREHVEAFCYDYKVDCWLPTSPWPDHLFMDLWGHLGPSGRDRFAAEFTDWWDENG